MKILCLNASPRKNGYTSKILTKMIEESKNQYDINQVNVYDLDFQPCYGCLQCRPDRSCVLPSDDAHKIASKINEADALIIGTPTYWGNIPGPLKSLFDRLVPTFEYIGEGLPKPMQKGKPAIIVVTSNAPWPYHILKTQSRGTVQAVRTVLKAGGFTIKRILNMPNAKKYDSIPKKYVNKAQSLTNKL